MPSAPVFDEAQLEFWRTREQEERTSAARAEGETRESHIRLADSYAALIAQQIGPGPTNVNE